MLEGFVCASVLNGSKVESGVPYTWWLERWLEEYGLSLKHANIKYQVPRAVVNERLEIVIVMISRLRVFCLRLIGCGPMVINVEHYPFHNNETGAQDKPTLDVRGGKVPLIEGNTDVKQRWTANLSTCSEFTGANDDEMPFCEMCYTAASDG